MLKRNMNCLNVTSYISHYRSPLGNMTLAGDGESLTGIWFDGQKYDRENIKNCLLVEKELEVFRTAITWLDSYFKGVSPDFIPNIKLSGSEFRKMICEIMLTIPYGKTMTYGEIAKEAAKRTGKNRISAQAVGGAVGHNPISVIIPCHRVIGSDGGLRGYAGGLDRKLKLLLLEGISI